MIFGLLFTAGFVAKYQISVEAIHFTH